MAKGNGGLWGWKKRRVLPLFFICFFFPRLALAVEEARLPELFVREVLPFYRQEVREGVFPGRDGVEIRYAKYECPEEKGALVLVGGRTEFLDKYAELLYDLRQSGFSLYLMDHRGQGFSGRMLANPEKGHVRDYNDYVADLKTFVDTVVNTVPHRRRFLLTHSMGGTIALLYLLQASPQFDGLVLCAPMLGIDTGALPSFLAWPLLKTLNLAPGPDSFFLGGKGYNPLKSFAANDLTGSEPRFLLQKKLLAEHPQAALGSPTNGWLLESYRAMAELARQAERVRLPILLLQAGEDRVVTAGEQERFCRQAVHCEKMVVAGARHELLMERDPLRTRVLAAALTFFAGLLP